LIAGCENYNRGMSGWADFSGAFYSFTCASFISSVG